MFAARLGLTAARIEDDFHEKRLGICGKPERRKKRAQMLKSDYSVRGVVGVRGAVFPTTTTSSSYSTTTTTTTSTTATTTTITTYN